MVLLASSCTVQGTRKSPAESLAGSEWRLVELGGAAVLDGAPATLSFAQPGRVAGDGSCNRFGGPVEIGDGTLRLGPLARTRRACPAPVMEQEGRYLAALLVAERFALEGAGLVVHARGHAAPLRFVPAAAGGRAATDVRPAPRYDAQPQPEVPE